MRLLLAHPFVTDSRPDPETFAFVRRHARELQRWFAEQLGYRLVVDSELARLHKRPAPGARLRPRRTQSQGLFDPRRYALLCLVLAALERLEVQTVLSELAEQVALLAASEEGVRRLGLESHAERQAFVDAVRWLVEIGVLTLADGEDTAFLEGRGDALYDIHSRRLFQLLSAPVPLAPPADPEELAADVYPDTEEGANRRSRHRLMRRLVEEPVLYLRDLDEGERAYLTLQRHYLAGQVTSRTVRDRLERLGGPRGTVRLAEAGEDERRAVADLLGLAELPRGELRLRLDRLDRALRGSRLGIGLPAALETLGGPLRDRSGEREGARLRWQEIWERAEAHPAISARPALRRWLADLRASGLLRRLAGDDERLLDQALAVLSLLPREMRLPVLASEALGTSHALDPGRPVATLVVRALAVLADRPPPRSAAERRDLWESAGVIADDLSCDVLVLGLAPTGGGRIGEALRAFAAEGEPVRLTLRQLAGRDLHFPSAPRVRVCENPVVVSAAAAKWGPDAAPLVCLGGYPNHAGRRLLTRLAHQGADLLYHGDFDWAGLQIANHLLKTLPIRPWRFMAPDYIRALETEAERPGLGDRPVAAQWDPDLAPAMAAAGMAVEEETVLEELLGDLRAL